MCVECVCPPTACPCPNKKQQRDRQRGRREGEGREQAKAADIPRQIKVRNADEKAKKVEESNALHNRKQGKLGKGKEEEEQQERRQEAGEKGKLLWDW